MAQKATKDTYAIENVGGVEVRRKVFAGDIVPAQWDVEGGAVEETEDKSEQQVGGEGTESQAAYGDSPDPAQQAEAEKEQSSGRSGERKRSR